MRNVWFYLNNNNFLQPNGNSLRNEFIAVGVTRKNDINIGLSAARVLRRHSYQIESADEDPESPSIEDISCMDDDCNARMSYTIIYFQIYSTCSLFQTR